MQSLKGIRDQLSVTEGVILLDAKRIVVPRAAVKSILARLHAGHPGINKSLQLAQKLFYWPGQNNDVKTCLLYTSDAADE